MEKVLFKFCSNRHQYTRLLYKAKNADIKI
jgi:hypothetical protein